MTVVRQVAVVVSVGDRNVVARSRSSDIAIVGRVIPGLTGPAGGGSGWSPGGNSAAPGDVLGTTNAEDLRIIAGGVEKIVVDSAATNVVIGDQVIATPAAHRQLFIGEAHPEFGLDGILFLAGDIVGGTAPAAFMFGGPNGTGAGFELQAIHLDGQRAGSLNISSSDNGGAATVRAKTASTTATIRADANQTTGLTSLAAEAVGATASALYRADVDDTALSASHQMTVDAGPNSGAMGVSVDNAVTPFGQINAAATIQDGDALVTTRLAGATQPTEATVGVNVLRQDSVAGTQRFAELAAVQETASDFVRVRLTASTENDSADVQVTPLGLRHSALDTAGQAIGPMGGRQNIFVPAFDAGTTGAESGTYLRTAMLQIGINVGASQLEIISTDHSGGNPVLVAAMGVALNPATGNYELVP